MDDALKAVIEAQKLSDSVYEIFVHQLGSTMEQAEDAARNPLILKQFAMSAGGAVLKFQGAAVMRSDEGAPIKTFLKATKFDHLLPPEKPDPIKSLEIPPDILASARAGNKTAEAKLFVTLHGSKPKSAEPETLAAVKRLLNRSGEADEGPGARECPPEASCCRSVT